MLHDVTKSIDNGIKVWPGDVEFRRKMVEKQGFYSSSVVMSLHTGTHMDAPAHRFPEGKSIDRCGPFIVTALLGRDNCRSGAAALFRGPICADTARKLAEAGVVLAGTDSISIDEEGSAEAHEILLGAGIPIIENLDLSQVGPGRYILLAFPLKFSGADGSPVRVLLAESVDDIVPADWRTV